MKKISESPGTPFCAFLRGVNVKGTTMKMADVCAVFEKAGMENVSSVLASGNILFSSSRKASALKPLLEKALSAHFKYEAFLFVKAKMDLEALWREQPFKPHPDFHIYSFVGNSGVENELMEVFGKSEKVPGEQATIVAGNFYWQAPKGNTLGSEFGKILGRKNLKDAFTSRNINTIEKVLKKM